MSVYEMLWEHRNDPQFANAPSPHISFMSICEFVRTTKGPYSEEDKAYLSYWAGIFKGKDEKLSNALASMAV